MDKTQKQEQNLLNDSFKGNANEIDLRSARNQILEIGAVAGAIDIGLFDLLESEFLSVEEIKEKLLLKCSIRTLEDLLDNLTGFKALERTGSIKENITFKYKTLNKNYLKSVNPEHQSVVQHFIYTMQQTAKYSKILKEGDYDSSDLFGSIYEDDTKTLQFMLTMGKYTSVNFEKIGDSVDFKKYKTFMDIGGATGISSIIIKKKHPHLHCISADLPKVTELAGKYLKEKQLDHLIELKCLDMFKAEEYPKTDVICMGNILHDWNDELKQQLFKKSYDALNDNGIYLIVEAIIDDERKNNYVALGISMLMNYCCRQGYNMSHLDIDKYAKQAGFKKTEVIGDIAVICFK